jgi:cysteine desulfurase/selenocysteine lyase
MFRTDFPLFTHSPDLVYLDSASTTQKPQKVLDQMMNHISHEYANIHRGSYDLSEASERYFENSKEYVRKFLGAQSRHEVIYTYNATYAANLLARTLVKSGALKSGDTILLSYLEHHANIVPWQIIAEEYNIRIEWIGLTEDGRIDMDDLAKKASDVELISLTAASNVTGATTNFRVVQAILQSVGDNRPLLVVDASQGFPHFALNVEELEIDFLFATGHKVMSDTGIGILYGKKKHLQSLLPALCGGGAINTVSPEGYEPAGLPYRYEPGTPHIIGASSLLASLQYIESIGGYETIEKYERELTEYALEKIQKLPE